MSDTWKTIYCFMMEWVGILLCFFTYVAISMHVYGYFAVIAHVLKKRLGIFFGLLWIAIGFVLVYNIVFNHFWAMMISPGGPDTCKFNE